jgi:ElaB/YqjD/DUF883 family membrane-anchored ribosome-binding protein
MFGTGKAQKAERVAESAWDHLVSAVETAGDSARSATRRGTDLVDEAQDRVSSVTDEARRRANAALDALAGRPPETPWGLIAGAIAAGAVLGWVAAAAAGRAPMLPVMQRPDPLPDYGNSGPVGTDPLR